MYSESWHIELTFLHRDGAIDELLPASVNEPNLDPSNHLSEAVRITPHDLVKLGKLEIYTRISMNHNTPGCEQPSGLDVNQSPNAQDTFQPIPGLFSCAGVTAGSVCSTN